MLRFSTFIPAALLTVSLPLLAASTAHAALDACGDISVEANAECAVEVEGGCTARCEPVSFQAACAVELQADCSGTCPPPWPGSCGCCSPRIPPCRCRR